MLEQRATTSATTSSTAFDWVVRGADVNPLENLWPEINRRQRLTAPRGVEAFKPWATRLRETALTMPPDTVLNLIKSMPRRVEGLIKASGGRTKY